MNRLREIDFMRSLASILILLLHSFAIFTASWVMPVGVEPILGYDIFGQFVSVITVPIFISISGMLYAFSEQRRHRPFIALVKNKFLHLLVPCYLFGIAYALCFNSNTNIWEIIVEITNGTGHLWFLTMLFWCFVFTYLIRLAKIPYWILFPLLLILFVLGDFVVLPLGITRVFSNLIYFVFGFFLIDKRDKIKFSNSVLWLVLIGFVGTFLLRLYLAQYYDNTNTTTLMAYLIKALFWGGRIMCAIFGITLYRWLSCKLTKSDNKLYILSYRYSKYSYGIYLFHQFILMGLYYHTALPMTISSYVLPWLSFLIILIVSWVLTALMLKTKPGRWLIG